MRERSERCARRYIIQKKKHINLLLLLTTFDGDPVGAFDGLVEGERDGSLLGLFEGDWLGVVVGYGVIQKREVSYVRYPSSEIPSQDMSKQHLPLLMVIQ